MKDLSEEIREIIKNSSCTIGYDYKMVDVSMEAIKKEMINDLFDRFKDKLVLHNYELKFFRLDVFVFTPDELKKILE